MINLIWLLYHQITLNRHNNFICTDLYQNKKFSLTIHIFVYIHVLSTRWCYVYINNTWISSILINCRSLSFSKEWKSFQKTLVVVRSESRKIVWNDSFLPIAGTCKITIPVIKAALPSNCISLYDDLWNHNQNSPSDSSSMVNIGELYAYWG